jgi:hypothetical protein
VKTLKLRNFIYKWLLDMRSKRESMKGLRKCFDFGLDEVTGRAAPNDRQMNQRKEFKSEVVENRWGLGTMSRHSTD